MWNVLAYHIPLDMMNSKLDCESVSQESRYYNKQCRCIKSNKTLVRQYAINKDTNLVCKSFIYSFPKIKQRSQLFFTQFPSRQTGVNRCGMTSTSWQHRIGLQSFFNKSCTQTAGSFCLVTWLRLMDVYFAKTVLDEREKHDMHRNYTVREMILFTDTLNKNWKHSISVRSNRKKKTLFEWS